tara:strand:- start:275 stop:1150 length:876 start_codon:yes stop_codon:yes gene_type:complete
VSRNKNRIIRETAELEPPTSHTPPTPPTPTREANPFGLSFVEPTEVVELPSAGRFYPEDHPLHGVSSIEIKQMTAKEEDILANNNYIDSGQVYERLLDSIIVNKSIKSKDLLPGDQDALLLRARRSGYGDEIENNEFCPSCGKRVDVKYDLSSVENKQTDLPLGVHFEESSSTFAFTLPKSNIKVSMRLLTGTEKEYMRKQRENKERLNIETNDTIDFLRQAIVSANGITDPGLLNQLVEVLPAIDSRKIRIMQKRLSPSIDTSQTATCPSCGSDIEGEIPFNLNFFWPEL